jgi:hypothetical protein
MEWIEMIGFGLGLVIGLVLGLLGGGGSVLIMPVLVYIFQLNPVEATAHSLLAVGCGAVMGTLGSLKNNQVNWKTGIAFGFPSMCAVYAVQRWGIDAIPLKISMFGYALTRDTFIMGIFAILMISAAYSMLRQKKERTRIFEERNMGWLIVLEGLIVGALTGLVGAGGGFLIVPALIILLRMSVEMAIGTSLFIIALKSFVGFFGAMGSGANINWMLILPFLTLTVTGCFFGSRWRAYIQEAVLKRMFGWLILIVGLVILTIELESGLWS